MTRKKDALKRKAKTLESAAKPRTVSREMREQVEEATRADKTPKWVSSLVDLAGALGVRRETLHRWRRKYADMPKARSDGRYRVEDFQNWMESTGRDAEVDEEMSEKEALEVRRLKAICDGLEFKNAVERREYLHKDEVRKQVGEATHVLRRALRSLKGALAQDIPGLPREEAVARIEAIVDAIQTQLHTGVWSDQ